MTKMLICSNCGKPRESGRKVCRECHLELARLRSKNRYDLNGRYTYNSICNSCKLPYKA